MLAFASTDVKISLFQNEKYLKIIEEKSRPDVLRRAKDILKDLEDLNDLKGDPKSDSELKKSIEDEETSLKSELEVLHESVLEDVCFDEDSLIRTVIMEVSGGIGGQEAMLFAAELSQVYQSYITSRGWSLNEIERNDSDLGGIHKVSIQIEGERCYQMLRHEAGVHRVQRIPRTEKAGRVHTSTATVHVIPIKKSQIDVEIPARDLKITSMRSSGPGGQHVNKTETRIAVTHLPTGICVECQETRSQEQNRLKALIKVKQLLWLREKEKLLQDYKKTKKTQVSSADRSDKTRTYNFPQDRITDHRLSENMYDLKSFMNGNSDRLDQLIQKLEINYKQSVMNEFFDRNKSD